MADVNITVDFNDLKLLNNELNKTNKKIKLTATDARRDFQSMKRSIDPLYNAMKTFEGKVLVAQRAVATGAISNKEYARSMELIRGQAAMAGVQVNQLGQVAALTGNKMNKFGSVGMQQVGYQVGDFLVQVQSGTNAMVAFGQQATQLVGVLGMMNPKFIGLSAGLGIAIPLVTALGAAWMRTRSDTDNAADSIETLEDRLKSLDSTLQDWVTTKKAAEAGLTVDELFGVQGIERAEKDVEAAKEALKEYEDIISGIDVYDQKAFKIAGEAIKSLWGADKASQVEAALKTLSDAEKRLAELRKKQSEERFASYTEEVAKLNEITRAKEAILAGDDKAEVSRRQALSSYRASLAEQVKAKDISAEQALILLDIFQTNQRLTAEIAAQEEAETRRSNRLKRNAEDSMQLLQDAIKVYEANQKLAEKDLATAEEILRVHGEKISVQSMQLQFGEDSLAVSRTIRDIELQNLITEIDSLQITTDKKDELINTVMVAANLADELERAQWATQNMTVGNDAWAWGLTGEEMLPPKEKPKKVTKTPEQQLKERMQVLLKEVQLRERIKGLSEDEQRREELKFEYQKLNMEVNDELIAQIVASEAATRKYIEAEQLREDQMETFSNHMEDAFEAMITGSKSVGDSFRDMLRNMLLDIYRQKVMEPMANSLTNSIFGMFMANGGAFNKGVQMFADGGVVNAPTMFGHSGGLGVMGEAGPEAIMPLKRGPDGKLGVAGANGGNVTVHQTFQFTANGDESVKKIIAQAAPQIANMTQKQIMDSRRRGGQMKATFN